MEEVKLQEEVQELKKLSEHYENQLKLIGFDLCDLPDDVSALLDECVVLQRATNLHDLGLNNLREYYYIKKKEMIEQNSIIAKQETEVKKIKQQIESNSHEVATLERFINNTNKRIVSDVSMERKKLQIETENKNLLERQESLKIHEDFNIDELIKKVDLLKNKASAEK